MNVIESGDFIHVRLTDLADDLFLLFSELSWVNDGLGLGRCLCLDRGCLWLRWILFLFLAFLLEFSELPEFFVFFPLLLRVDICLDDLAFRFDSFSWRWHSLRLGHGNSCLGLLNLLLRVKNGSLRLLDLFLDLLCRGLGLNV